MAGSLISSTVNFGLLTGTLAYYLREPLKKFVSQRQVSVRDELQKTATLLRQAQDRYEEYSAKLKAIEAELGSIREQTRQDVEALKIRILGDAKRLADTIISDTRANTVALQEELLAELKQSLIDEVVLATEKLLRGRTTKEVVVHLNDQFSRQVEERQ